MVSLSLSPGVSLIGYQVVILFSVCSGYPRDIGGRAKGKMRKTSCLDFHVDRRLFNDYFMSLHNKYVKYWKHKKIMKHA